MTPGRLRAFAFFSKVRDLLQTRGIGPLTSQKVLQISGVDGGKANFSTAEAFLIM